MNDIFFTRRIKATASTLRRVISDKPVEESEISQEDVADSYRAAMTTESVARPLPKFETSSLRKESAKLLVLRAPLPMKEETVLKEDNAFADMGEHNARPPANSVVEPNISNTKLLLMAQDAVETQIDNIAPDRILTLINEITPDRMRNIFADSGEAHVDRAVQAYAPEKISALVEKITPAIIESEVSLTVAEKVTERLAEELPGGIEASVGRIVQEEMQGAFGYSVTRKIRQLIREELNSVLKG